MTYDRSDVGKVKRRRVAHRTASVTIRDVARHANVSTASVSRVLASSATVSDQLRERVTASVTALGFTPDKTAQMLGCTRSPTLHIASFLDDRHGGPLLHAMTRVFQQAGYVVSTSIKEHGSGALQHVVDGSKHANVMTVTLTCSGTLSDPLASSDVDGVHLLALGREVSPGLVAEQALLLVSAEASLVRHVVVDTSSRLGVDATSSGISPTPEP